jgi:hypothetical protein
MLTRFVTSTMTLPSRSFESSPTTWSTLFAGTASTMRSASLIASLLLFAASARVALAASSACFTSAAEMRTV